MLVLVVGPSGVGKDTLLRAARLASRRDDRIVFPRREIDRAPSRLERNIYVDLETHRDRERGGGYALSWSAHDRVYGVPISMEAELAAGRVVVVNVSRSVLPDARARYGPLRIVLVNAASEVIEQRLRDRPRPATEDEIAERIARASAFTVEGPDVVTVENNGSVKAGIAGFLAALSA